jgi:hypothetical protein
MDDGVSADLVRSVLLRSVLLLQAVADHVYDPLTACWSSTRDTPCASGKYGEIRASWRSLSRKRSPISASSTETLNHSLAKFVGPEPSKLVYGS